jgi:hypothetical protein
LSFRNEEDSLKSWHFNDRNKSLRQRRSLLSVRSNDDEQPSESDSHDSSAASPAIGAFNDVSDDGSEVLNIDDDEEVIKLVRNKRNNNKISVDVETDLESFEKASANDPTRSRRDATVNCGSNVNTKTRQLNVGCSDENKIDVSPQCNDDGEEGEYLPIQPHSHVPV